jgi:hypothetical protein
MRTKNPTDTPATIAPAAATPKPVTKRPIRTRKPPAATSTPPTTLPSPAEKRARTKPVLANAATSAADVGAEKALKPKKPKMVRDSFTIPKMEYAVLETMKARAAQLASPAKKTELFRAGIKALAALPDAEFLAAIHAVPSLKTGRPAKPSAE